MKYKNRIKEKVSQSQKLDDEEIRTAATEIFGELAECFAIVGYTNGAEQKFAIKVVDNDLCDDVLEPLRESIVQWYHLTHNFREDDDNGD
jgi:hypothetical protein